ncbi:hypothetical protein ES703_65790 [subsurface metagenome]
MPEIKLDLRAATLIVAANDSLNRNMANYVCDGVADDIEINAALNALPASGGRVMLSEGTYNIVDSITIPANNITLRGQGRSTLIDGDGLGNNEHAIVVSGVTNCVIKKLAIQTKAGGGNTIHCIALSNGCNSFTIESVTIVDSDSDGINISGTDILNGIIRDCSIEGADEWGIYCNMTGDMLRIHIRDCFITGCGLDGMKLFNVDYGLVEGNTCYSNGNNGIYVLNTDYAKLADNICIGNIHRGIYLLGVDNSTIEDNLCYLNTLVNIHIGGTSSHNIVEGNQCISANSATSDGIDVDGNAHNNSIIGNSCISNGRYGIYVWGDYNKVTSNHVCLSGDHGIYVTDAYCQIEGNYVYDNGQDAADTYDGIRLGADADHCSVTNNFVSGPTAGRTQEDCIHLEDGCVMVTIVGNHCSWGLGSGIHLVANNDGCTITGNFCYDNDDYGIAVLTSDENTITGNNCTGNGSHGIYVYRSSHNSLTGNSSNANGADGINVTGDGTTNSDYNTLTSNVCRGNTGNGIEIEGDKSGGNDYANKNIVVANQLFDNTGANLDNDGTNTDLGHNITA